MRVVIFSSHRFERPFLDAANQLDACHCQHLDVALNADTAALAAGAEVVCLFANDQADAPALRVLAAGGTRLLALRCAGFNQVDLAAAAQYGLRVMRVSAYSPYAVAEHAVALLMTLNRQIHRAWNRVREQNFALEGLLGFDLHGKTVGVIGTGKIGRVFARIMSGFGCEVLASDPVQDASCLALGVRYVELDELAARADVISLHCPLNNATHHLINADVLARMKPSAFLINTGRGALIDTRALIQMLKCGRPAGVALDVYEEEAEWFFADHSRDVITDDQLVRLISFPNVLITGHQGFFTREALTAIATTTFANIADWRARRASDNDVPLPAPGQV